MDHNPFSTIITQRMNPCLMDQPDLMEASQQTKVPAKFTFTELFSYFTTSQSNCNLHTTDFSPLQPSR